MGKRRVFMCQNNVRSSDMTDHIYRNDWSEYIGSEMLSGHFTNDKFLWIIFSCLQVEVNFLFSINKHHNI